MSDVLLLATVVQGDTGVYTGKETESCCVQTSPLQLAQEDGIIFAKTITAGTINRGYPVQGVADVLRKSRGGRGLGKIPDDPSPFTSTANRMW